MSTRYIVTVDFLDMDELSSLGGYVEETIQPAQFQKDIVNKVRLVHMWTPSSWPTVVGWGWRCISSRQSMPGPVSFLVSKGDEDKNEDDTQNTITNFLIFFIDTGLQECIVLL